jgi:hypothetical protein
MKPIYTVIMSLIFLGLGAYIYFFERQPLPGAEENQKPKVQILQLTPQEVSKVSISRGQQKTLLEQDKAGQWQIKGPSTGPANQTAIKTLLDHLKDWPALEVLEPTFQSVEKKTFGLAETALKLEIDSSAGKKEILIGNKTPINSGYYVLSADGKQLYLSYINIPEELEQMLNQPPTAKPAASATQKK